VYNLLAIITLLLSCYSLLRILKPEGTLESILVFFCISTAYIAGWGYVLSSMNHLNDVKYWAISGLSATFINFLILFFQRNSRQSPAFPKPSSPFHFITSFKDWYIKELSSFEKLLLTPLIFTVLLLGVTNLIIIIFSAPHNWDSMSYHLARVAYYLQHDNLNSFNANYWAQVIHPKNSTLLLLYTYLVSGKWENSTQLVQFASYWIAVCSIYLISKKAGNNKTQSIFAATVGALLTEWLLQATTTQNDMILTAYMGSIVYFLFAFREARKWKYLGLTALGIGLSIGTKASSLLPLLSAVLVALYILFFNSKAELQHRFRDFVILASCTLLACCVFALPSGYVENYINFGNPIGPADVRTEHDFEGKHISDIAKNGTKNLIRYAFDFLSLDGLPSFGPVNQVQTSLRFLPRKIVNRLGIDLETSVAARVPFDLQKLPVSHEDGSYWGIFGFGLVWIMVFLSLIGVIKSTDIRVLSLAAVLFLILQAYSGPYDPWRGRYFIICAIFAVPTISAAVQTKNKFVFAYLLLVVWIGCISAVSAVAFRENSALITTNYFDEPTRSIFTMNRLEQITSNRSDYYKPLAEFERLVPGNATVAVFLHLDSYEYPLFGEYLTRTIIPINSYFKGPQPIPSNADYLLYTKNEYPCPAANDLYLGADWYLRKLTATNRQCP
jgi:hypothetical protein